MELREIIGNTTTTPNPQSDWDQPDVTKPDYIKNKPTILTETDVKEIIAENKPTYTASEVGALPSTTIIPTTLAQLKEDSTHRVVTDAEKATWNAKSDFCNPNLLINGEFKINQRQNMLGENSYTYDRWKSAGVVDLIQTSDYIEYTSTGQWNGFSQYIENPRALSGKTVTLSAKVSVDGSNSVDEKGNPNGSKVFVLGARRQKPSDTQSTVLGAVYPTINQDEQIVQFTLTLPNDISDSDRVWFNVVSRYMGQKIKLYYAKLEIGEIATPLSPRPYAEELALCQRYYQKIDIYGACFIATEANPTALTNIPLIAPIRKSYTLSIDKYPSIMEGPNKGETPTSLSSQALLENSMRIAFPVPSLTFGSVCFLRGGTAIIDAEIY